MFSWQQHFELCELFSIFFFILFLRRSFSFQFLPFLRWTNIFLWIMERETGNIIGSAIQEHMEKKMESIYIPLTKITISFERQFHIIFVNRRKMKKKTFRFKMRKGGVFSSLRLLLSFVARAHSSNLFLTHTHSRHFILGPSSVANEKKKWNEQKKDEERRKNEEKNHSWLWRRAETFS